LARALLIVIAFGVFGVFIHKPLEAAFQSGGNWWVEARILGGFSTGPLLADQKYLADGEAFFGKDG